MGIMPNDAVPHIPNCLPRCPGWCAGGHVDEDTGVEETGIAHFAYGPGDWLPSLSNSLSGRIHRQSTYEVSTSLRQLDLWTGHHGTTFVDLQLSMVGSDDVHGFEVPLTPGEARSLAAALTHLADQAEGLR